MQSKMLNIQQTFTVFKSKGTIIISKVREEKIDICFYPHYTQWIYMQFVLKTETLESKVASIKKNPSTLIKKKKKEKITFFPVCLIYVQTQPL